MPVEWLQRCRAVNSRSDWPPCIVDAYLPALMVAKPSALTTLENPGYLLAEGRDL